MANLSSRMSSKIRKQRIFHAELLLQQAFEYYNVYISTEDILAHIADNIYSNKDKYTNIYSNRTIQPLLNLCGEPKADRRFIICFLRRLCRLVDHALLIKRKSIILNNKPASLYSYAIVKVGEKSKISSI